MRLASRSLLHLTILLRQGALVFGHPGVLVSLWSSPLQAVASPGDGRDGEARAMLGVGANDMDRSWQADAVASVCSWLFRSLASKLLLPSLRSLLNMHH